MTADSRGGGTDSRAGSASSAPPDGQLREGAVLLEIGVLASFATLVFVVVFNFFLFRVVAGDPVANLFRGRNLTRRAARGAASPVRARRLDSSTSSGGISTQTAQVNFGRSYTSNEPVWYEIASRAWPTIALVGVATVLSAVIGVALGIVAGWNRGQKSDYAAHVVHHDHVLDAGLLARDAVARRVRRDARLVPDRRA